MMNQLSRLGLCVTLAGCLLGPVQSAQAQAAVVTTQDKQIVASSIREKGFDCEDVATMRRSTDGVSEGRTVWIAQCASASYKVTYMGDTGFTVVRVE